MVWPVGVVQPNWDQGWWCQSLVPVDPEGQASIVPVETSAHGIWKRQRCSQCWGEGGSSQQARGGMNTEECNSKC